MATPLLVLPSPSKDLGPTKVVYETDQEDAIKAFSEQSVKEAEALDVSANGIVEEVIKRSGRADSHIPFPMPVPERSAAGDSASNSRVDRTVPMVEKDELLRGTPKSGWEINIKGNNDVDVDQSRYCSRKVECTVVLSCVMVCCLLVWLFACLCLRDAASTSKFCAYRFIRETNKETSAIRRAAFPDKSDFLGKTNF